MLYNLESSQKFNLAYYIALKIEKVKNREDCPLPYGLLLTRLYRHVLAKHPKLFRPHSKLHFVLHFRVMNSINAKTEKGKAKDKEAKAQLPNSPSSAESTNQSSPLLCYLQREALVNQCEEQPNERTPSPPPRKKSLSSPQAPSKSISSKSTHYTSSSSPSSSNPSPPPRVSRPSPGFPNPPPEFEPLPSTQSLFVNINNNTPHLLNNEPPLENIYHPPPNLGNQDFPNPPNILDFVHPNDMPHLHNMFCQCCSTTRHEIQMLRNRVNYMFSYIRHHLGSSSNPPYFPH
ncbi:hypothetical protein Tco_0585720 [Tanacetum coccineum]